MRFALVGNPNSGKTTLFNSLTGSSAHVGNWGGVTVGKNSGIYKKKGKNGDKMRAEIIDLPGIYSLSPYTPEEIVSRNYILDDKPDGIINIVDATNLERNLYLTTQLLELDIPIVVALNMSDVLQKNGDVIDIDKLEQALGVQVVQISALKGKGFTELMTKAIKSVEQPRLGQNIYIGTKYEDLVSEVYELAKEKFDSHLMFHTIKLIERDDLEIKGNEELLDKIKYLESLIDSGYFEGDYEAIIADCRYKYITKYYCIALKKNSKNQVSKSLKIDKVMTHKIWGIPIFIGIMMLIFHFTFSENLLLLGVFIPEGSFSNDIFGTDSINSLGVILANLMEWGTSSLMNVISSAMPAGTWYTGLVCDGLLSGIFAVFSFIPQILVLFLFLSILEDSGYMARIAFIMDRLFRKFGLSGKSFMPLLMCFGCAVPGIMATRTLEDEGEKRRTIMLTPFFSCGAKLPIWSAFAGVFASQYKGMNAELVVFFMYFLGVAVALITALLLKKTSVKQGTSAFLMELPAYHMPQAKNLAFHLWDKLKHYIYKAATIIAGATIVIWFLSTFSFTFRMVESDNSMLGIIAKGITWLFVPLGWGMGDNGWMFVVAAITGLIAKEMVVATLGTFSGIEGDALEMSGGEIVGTSLGTIMLTVGGTLGGLNVSIPAMLSFLAFNLLSVPCMAAVAAARGELYADDKKKGRKHMWIAIGFWMATAYITSFIIFWFGVLCVACWWAALIVALVIIATIITLLVLSKKGIINLDKLKFKKPRKVAVEFGEVHTDKNAEMENNINNNQSEMQENQSDISDFDNDNNNVK